MKNKINNFIKSVIVITIALISYSASAQEGYYWNLTGNSGTDSTNFIGTIDSQTVRIKVDSIDRIVIQTNDSINFKGYSIFDSIRVLNFIGTIDSTDFRIRVDSVDRITVKPTDSIIFKGYAIFDSIKILNYLKVSPDSDAFTWTPGVLLPVLHDRTRTTTGRATFTTQNWPTLGYSTLKMGVGTESPNAKIHLFEVGATPVYSLYNNGGSFNSPIGFNVGIDGGGDAQLIQNLDKPMYFYTNSGAVPGPRMTIDRGNALTGGFVGIGVTSPNISSLLHADGDVNLVTHTGEVFRTNAPAGFTGIITEAWRMFRPVGALGSTEIGSIYNFYTAAAPWDFTLQQTHPYVAAVDAAKLNFNTGGKQRMFITNNSWIWDPVSMSYKFSPNFCDITTNNFHRMMLTGDGTIGFAGPILQDPYFVVVGNQSPPSQIFPNLPCGVAYPNYNLYQFRVAEFRSANATQASTGINIRGSRENRFDNAAFIDLTDYNDTQIPPVDFIMSKISSDPQSRIDITNFDSAGYFKIYTNEGGHAGENGLTHKFLINNLGYTGVGTIFEYGNCVNPQGFKPPFARLDVYDPNATSAPNGVLQPYYPHLRLTSIYDVSTPFADPNLCVRTDFTTTNGVAPLSQAGNLIINPTNPAPAAGFYNMGTVAINDDDAMGAALMSNPGLGISVNGQAKIKTMNTGTGEAVVWNSADGILYVDPTIGGIPATCPGSALILGPGHDVGVQLKDNNIYYYEGLINPNTAANKNSFGIGIPCSTGLGAKLDVLRNLSPTPTDVIPTGLQVINHDLPSVAGYQEVGINCLVDGIGPLSYGGKFNAVNAKNNIGGYLQATNPVGDSYENFGSYAWGYDSYYNIGVTGLAYSRNYNGWNGASLNFGGNFLALSDDANSVAIGVNSLVIPSNATSTNYGVCTQNLVNDTHNWAIYANGRSGGMTDWNPSDSNIKQNIIPITNALNIINQLKAKYYNFDTISHPALSLPSGQQDGLISQDVKSVIPYIVDSMPFPARYDTAGILITPGETVLGLEYTALIPFLVQGEKELDSSLIHIGTQNGAWNDSGKIEWGTNPLIHNTVIPMASGITEPMQDWSIYFTGQSDMSNYLNPVDVGIGYFDTTTNLFAKLDVKDSTFSGDGFNFVNQYAGRFNQTGDYNEGGGGDDMIAVFGFTDVTHSGVDGDNSTNIGGEFSAVNSYYSNIGVVGSAKSRYGDNYGMMGTAILSSVATGVNGNGIADDYSYGVWGYATHGDSLNYGIYGTLDTVAGAANYAGYFDGDVYCTGSYLPSDLKLKRNIQPFDNALSQIEKLKVKTYEFNTSEYKSMNLPSGKQIGLISEDVEKVAPQLVKKAINPARKNKKGEVTDKAVDFVAVNYTGMIPLLIKGMQEQQSQIDSLKTIIANCCSTNNTGMNNQNSPNNLGDNNNVNTHTIDLSSLNSSPMLYQNQPNPFNNGGTKIKYFIPGNINNAQISFFDEFGNAMTVFNITDKGMGELIVTADNLASGVYSYSLIIDNKVIDTKRMMKIK